MCVWVSLSKYNISKDTATQTSSGSAFYKLIRWSDNSVAAILRRNCNVGMLSSFNNAGPLDFSNFILSQFQNIGRFGFSEFIVFDMHASRYNICLDT